MEAVMTDPAVAQDTQVPTINLLQIKTLAPELYSLLILLISSDMDVFSSLDQAAVDLNITVEVNGKKFDTLEFLRTAQQLFEELNQSKQRNYSQVPLAARRLLRAGVGPDDPTVFRENTYIMHSSTPVDLQALQSALVAALNSETGIPESVTTRFGNLVDKLVKLRVEAAVGGFMEQIKRQVTMQQEMLDLYDTSAFTTPLRRATVQRQLRPLSEDLATTLQEGQLDAMNKLHTMLSGIRTVDMNAAFEILTTSPEAATVSAVEAPPAAVSLSDLLVAIAQ